MSEQNKKGWAEEGPDSDGEDIQRSERTHGGTGATKSRGGADSAKPNTSSAPQYEGRAERRERSMDEKLADINPSGPFTV